MQQAKKIIPLRYTFTIQLLITLLLSSCGTKKEQTNLKLKDCINTEVLDHINNLQKFSNLEITKRNDFDLFDSIAEFENIMIS